MTRLGAGGGYNLMRSGRMGSGNLGSQLSGQAVDKGLPPLPSPSQSGEGYGEAQRGSSRRMNIDGNGAVDQGEPTGLRPKRFKHDVLLLSKLSGSWWAAFESSLCGRTSIS
jgi:hypothetical protein